jgi:hypothetical protein
MGRGRGAGNKRHEAFGEIKEVGGGGAGRHRRGGLSPAAGYGFPVLARAEGLDQEKAAAVFRVGTRGVGDGQGGTGRALLASQAHRTRWNSYGQRRDGTRKPSAGRALIRRAAPQ